MKQKKFDSFDSRGGVLVEFCCHSSSLIGYLNYGRAKTPLRAFLKIHLQSNLYKAVTLGK